MSYCQNVHLLQGVSSCHFPIFLADIRLSDGPVAMADIKLSDGPVATCMADIKLAARPVINLVLHLLMSVSCSGLTLLVQGVEELYNWLYQEPYWALPGLSSILGKHCWHSCNLSVKEQHNTPGCEHHHWLASRGILRHSINPYSSQACTRSLSHQKSSLAQKTKVVRQGETTVSCLKLGRICTSGCYQFPKWSRNIICRSNLLCAVVPVEVQLASMFLIMVQVTLVYYSIIVRSILPFCGTVNPFVGGNCSFAWFVGGTGSLPCSLSAIVQLTRLLPAMVPLTR